MSDYFDRDEFRNDFDDPTKDIDDDPDRSPYVECWKGYKEEIKNADLRTLQELANTDKIDPGFALQVVNNLYLYNSTVNIIKNSKHNKLLVLPESEVVIDLFNDVEEEDYQEVCDDIKETFVIVDEFVPVPPTVHDYIH